MLAGILIFACLVRRRSVLFVCALIAGCLFGLWRGDTRLNQLVVYEQYVGREVSLNGIVSEDATITQKGEQRIRLSNIRINAEPLEGTVWMSTIADHDIKRGDHLTATSKLNEGFGTFSAAMFHANITAIERPYPGDVGRRIRDGFTDQVRETIPEPQVSLAAGYLTGQKNALPETLSDQLRTVGLTHVVVASGYNLTILVQFARRLLAERSKYLAVFSSSLLIASFILITGFSPSMSRAGLVAGLGLLAWYYGRTIHPLVLLPFAAAVTALIEPSYVWGDIGWYLSFAAFAGVLIFAPLITRFLWSAEPGLLKRLIVETLSAQLLTLPLIIYTFSQYSPYALLANILVLPLVPLVMVLTFLTGISNLIFPFIGSLMSLPCILLLKYMTTVVEGVASLPGARSEIEASLAISLLGYAVLVAVCIVLWRITNYNFRSKDT